MKLDELTRTLLCRAIEIYWREAFPGGPAEPPAKVLPPPAASLGELLLFLTDESSATEAGPHRRWTLRLGCEEYPHSKLVVEEVLLDDEFFFLVDTHDELDLASDSEEYERWQALRRSNRRRKFAIEETWAEAGIPTLRDLRERVEAQAAATRTPPRGIDVLLVDDDEERARALAGALALAGYGAIRVAAPAEALAAARARRIALILADASAGGAGGHALCDALKAEAATAGVPLALITPYPQYARLLTAADACISRPVRLGTLHRMIETLIHPGDGGGPGRAAGPARASRHPTPPPVASPRSEGPLPPVV